MLFLQKDLLCSTLSAMDWNTSAPLCLLLHHHLKTEACHEDEDEDSFIMHLHRDWKDLSQSLKNKKIYFVPQQPPQFVFTLLQSVVYICLSVLFSSHRCGYGLSSLTVSGTTIFTNLSDYADKTFCLCPWALHLLKLMKDCAVFFSLYFQSVSEKL